MENVSGSKQGELVQAESSAKGMSLPLGEGEVQQTPETPTTREDGKDPAHNQLRNVRDKQGRTGQLERRRPTGPRTRRGKRKSRYNATKHAMFFLGLLDSESRDEYCELVNGLVESLQAIGDAEEKLAEKLAFHLLRYRRLLRAERAEITIWSEPQETEPGVSTSASVMLSSGLGLVFIAKHMKDEGALTVAVRQFKRLRDQIEEQGLDWDRDQDALKLLFGTEGKPRIVQAPEQARGVKVEIESQPSGPIAETYRKLTQDRKETSQGDSSKVYSDVAKKWVIDSLTSEIEEFEPMLKRWVNRKEKVRELGMIAALVPPQQIGDRLQRYEGMLERNFDRTLSQIERLQRMRLG